MAMRNQYLSNPAITRRRLLTIAGSSAVGVGSAGCLGLTDGGSEDGGQDNSSQNDEAAEPENHSHEEDVNDPVSHADVAMLTDEEGHHFEPHVVWVEAGGTVTWTNESGSHTATAYHPEFDTTLRMPESSEPWDSGMFSEEGKTFEHTFEVEGVYDYFCVPHEHRGMVGSVIVGDPDPHDQPGLADPQEGLPEEAREVLINLNEQVNDALGHTHE